MGSQRRSSYPASSQKQTKRPSWRYFAEGTRLVITATCTSPQPPWNLRRKPKSSTGVFRSWIGSPDTGPWGTLPSWELSPYSLDLLAERGFLYDSSLMGDDAPYFVDTANGRMVEIPVEWALDDVPYYAFSRGAGSMNTPEDVYKAWEWEFDGAYQYGRALTLTMHPQVTGRLAKIMVLERLIKYMQSHTGAEFFRCCDVAKARTADGMRPSD
jgi:hypothetical protein